jgi:hypothetical protein
LILNYSGDLKTRDNHKFGRLGISCHTFWLRDKQPREAVLEIRRPEEIWCRFRGWPTEKFRLEGAQSVEGALVVASLSEVRNEPCCLWITAETEHSELMGRECLASRAAFLPHVVCCQVELRALSSGLVNY